LVWWKNRLAQTTLRATLESLLSAGPRFKPVKTHGVHTISQKASRLGPRTSFMLDVMKIGGVSGWLHAIGQTEAAGLSVSSYLFPEISAQLLAVSQQAHWLEYQDWAAPILQRPFELKHGFALPQRRPAVDSHGTRTPLSVTGFARQTLQPRKRSL
jgi:hypothetical protein